MKIKTSELQGVALDWAVAKCEGKDGDCETHAGNIWYGRVTSGFTRYHPSTNRDQGHEILERFQENETTFCLFFNPYRDCPEHGNSRPWSAEHRGTRFSAETPLIAAMRCYVASKLGEEVDVPIELTQLGETK
jgi:hypothetical protein